ncbi:hypothetical protein J1N35_033760 [Gossypium stocksii]|uniref:Uncharacterized protein n=1 Tax=Gossypium stocksii TaxID=47602 RepID=A0A9D3UQS4_9ROSI|nr:hypothetical protein J1N35_033760 [Gossypium stocksii]
MPKNGEDWPLVSDMVAINQRLLVFTSIQSKEASEGIAYQWNYMVENQLELHGQDNIEWLNVKLANEDDRMQVGSCSNMAESSGLDDKTKSLALRSEGGGSLQAVDTLNGKLLCGCDDIHACVAGSTSGACTP